MSLIETGVRDRQERSTCAHARWHRLVRFLLGLSLVAAIGGCAGGSVTRLQMRAAPGDKTTVKSVAEGGTLGGKTSDAAPAFTAKTSDAGQSVLSSPTTAGGTALYDVIGGSLGGQAPYGSGDGMLALAGGTRMVSLRSNDGDELSVTITVEYNNYRPDRGEMWDLVPAQRGTLTTYGVVPVRLNLMTADGRVGFTIERGELVSAEPPRAAIEDVYSGPLTGTLAYNDFAKIDPPCSEVRVLLDFRTDELRARLQFENELNVTCKRWETSAPPIPWGALLASPSH